MDMSTPKLYTVILEDSRLIFDDTADYTFDCEILFAQRSTVIMGTDANPHTHNL
jgi:hypothetical protein